jgi:hypothetical protein
VKTEEDEAFEALERRKELDRMYEIGWNSALEMAASHLENDFRNAFGPDTLTSIAVYVKGFKK